MVLTQITDTFGELIKMNNNQIAGKIVDAAKRINPYILKTPLIHSKSLSQITGANVYLKLESEQYTGSFKARGALNKVLECITKGDNRPFITASTGNHAKGVARALDITKKSGKICLPVNTDEEKIKSLEYYNVEIVKEGYTCLETEIYARELAKEENRIWISPYNDYPVIFGQGTLAREITDKLREVHTVFGCIGGGGMMSGVSAWFKSVSPNTHLVGCLPENAPEMYLSMEEGAIVQLDNPKETLSDSSAGGLEEGAVTFDICGRNIHDYVLSSEQEIASAIKFMLGTHHKLIEGAAGVALAGFLNESHKYVGKNVVIIICGSNISTAKISSVIN